MNKYVLIFFKTFYLPLGNIEKSNEVFKWILEQKADESIDLIDRETLFEYIGTKDFLAVIFCKY